jgi:hypothetical protein
MRWFLIAATAIAIVLCVCAQGRPPNATPSTNTETGGSVGKLNTSQKTDSAQNASPAKPIIPTCDQAAPCYVVDQPQAKSKEQQAKDDSLDVLTRRYMCATIIGVIGAFIGIGILIWQTTIFQTTANAAKLNAQAVINAERPWLTVCLQEIPDNDGMFTFRITNNGRTPSDVISGTLDHTFAENMDALSKEPAYLSPFTYPYQSFLTQGEFFDIHPPFMPDAIINNRLNSGQAIAPNQILFLYGRIVYEDMLGKDRPDTARHETRWCFAYVSGGPGFVRTGSEKYDRYT